MRLTPEQLTMLRVEGAAFPISVLLRKEASEHLGKFRLLERALGGSPAAIELTQMHLTFKWAADLARDSRVIEPVSDVIGSDIAIWATSIFSKRVGDETYVGWHQDAKYWGLTEPVISAWIALTPSTPANGCMRIVKGSQSRGLLPHVEGDDHRNVLSRRQHVSSAICKDDVVDVVLDEGDMSLHDLLVIHGSPKNRSSSPRVGFVVRYLPPSVVDHSGVSTDLMLACGERSQFPDNASFVEVPDSNELSAVRLETFAHARTSFLQGVRSSVERER